ncbi:hypothetical protein GCM10025760_04430 [Microbacterium yannicii]|uniref:MarR family transcriptional regulator n=1 Tax=Microbacterium yannicii TaxID=671622 RepID=A0ABP9LXK2_9MICO|nr:MarR family winged helix-turn-helix transcriptional regulator [Microbacterium yannicii]MCO5953642.1 MarR family winged helix-turn-helix transcriptional regulator [Microbacterium yannicii]
MNDIIDNEENDDQHDTEAPRPAEPRPLGYWLRAVDALLTREFATALEAEGIGRRDWMLLNVLSGDIDAPELRERLARKGKRLRGLEERGWVVEHGDGTWALTDLGRAEKERISGIVDGIRSRVVDAVGDAEAYTALTSSLEAIARELGWDENTAGRERGFGGFGRPGFGRGGVPGFGPEFRGHGVGPGFRPNWGPGFGGRPRPFDPDIHDGYGHNRHRGFAPGRPGHPAERFDEPMRGYGEHGCAGHHPHAGHSHFDHDGDHGHDHGHDGAHGHGHGHGGERGRGRGGRGAQQAYERGFDAGFARGRESGAA